MIDTTEQLFFSSEWSTLDLPRILEADDILAVALSQAVELEEKLKLISGWHYDFFNSHKDSFPKLSLLLDEFGCLGVEDVHNLSPLTVRRAGSDLSESSQMILDAELDSLIRLPAFHSCRGMLPPFLDSVAQIQLAHSTHIEEISREKSLIEQFFFRLGNQKPRVQEIVRARLGIDQEPLTLEQTGKLHNVTRERIRQIDKKFWIKTEKGELWDDYLRKDLQTRIEDFRSPIALEKLEATDSWYEGVSKYTRIFNEILRKLTNDSFFLVSIDDRFYVYNNNQDFLDAQIHRYLAARSTGTTIEKSIDALESNLRGFAHELEQVFSSQSFEFTHPFSRARITVAGRPYIASVVRSFLDQVLEPFTLDQFLAVCIEIGIDTSEQLRTIKNTLLKDFQLLGNGGDTYISENAIKNQLPDYADICDRIYELVSKKNLHRVWHLDEISPWLIRIGIIPVKAPDNAWVLACMKFDPMKRFGLRRYMFWMAESGIENPPNLEDQVIAVLKQSGQAMSTQEVKLALSEVRGVGKTFQIHPSEEKGIYCPVPGRFIYVEPSR